MIKLFIIYFDFRTGIGVIAQGCVKKTRTYLAIIEKSIAPLCDNLHHYGNSLVLVLRFSPSVLHLASGPYQVFIMFQKGHLKVEIVL